MMLRHRANRGAWVLREGREMGGAGHTGLAEENALEYGHLGWKRDRLPETGGAVSIRGRLLAGDLELALAPPAYFVQVPAPTETGHDKADDNGHCPCVEKPIRGALLGWYRRGRGRARRRWVPPCGGVGNGSTVLRGGVERVGSVRRVFQRALIGAFERGLIFRAGPPVAQALDEACDVSLVLCKCFRR